MFAGGSSSMNGRDGNGVQGEVESRVNALDKEIKSFEEEIKKLQQLRASLIKERNELVQSSGNRVTSSSSSIFNNPNPQPSSKERLTDYFKEKFPWSGELLPRARKTWKIQNFRSVQEAVCNAAIDGRDIVCVMPTGGGKSLCYQLPALMSVGLTLVISPLISLSTDQLWHLREAGVPCEMLSSSNSKAESMDIHQRIKSGQDDMKVLFVTPERMAKSNTMRSALQKCYERDRLARIVIDEAHCCSEQGHDFRPDYQKLAVLKNMYPNVPILCLSATLTPSVLKDVLNILQLPDVVDPAKAPQNGTLYFTAPLERPNLHYSVISRPSAALEANQKIVDWILEHHQGESGIIYTLTKAETQRMADALTELGGGKIRSAVYHGDQPEYLKQEIHQFWREGRIQVVVATIAFGMGIDKGDVRFVIHANMGKSLDSYYQETGRAGRDGLDADCVLFYRPSDVGRVSGLQSDNSRGRTQIQSMLEYVHNIDCRKKIFSNYFKDQYGDGSACGTCDNCINQPEETDVTLEAWKLAKILEESYEDGGRITMSALCDLARGNGGGQFNVVKRKKGRRSGKKTEKDGFLDVKKLIGDKVLLSKEDAERVCIRLQMLDFIMDEFVQTAYNVNTYVAPGRSIRRLTRLDRQRVEAKEGCPTIMADLQGTSKKRKKASTNGSGAASSTPKQASGSGTNGRTSSASKKGKAAARLQIPDSDNLLGTSSQSTSNDDEPLMNKRQRMLASNRSNGSKPSTSEFMPKIRVDWLEEEELEEQDRKFRMNAVPIPLYGEGDPEGDEDEIDVKAEYHQNDEDEEEMTWRIQMYQDENQPLYSSGNTRDQPIELD